MKKLNRFLLKEGYNIEFIRQELFKGKKSFYGDGVYTADVYKVSKGEENYTLTMKITGRKVFFLHDTESNKLICGSPCQDMFIGLFKCYLNKAV